MRNLSQSSIEDLISKIQSGKAGNVILDDAGMDTSYSNIRLTGKNSVIIFDENADRDRVLSLSDLTLMIRNGHVRPAADDVKQASSPVYAKNPFGSKHAVIQTIMRIAQGRHDELPASAIEQFEQMDELELTRFALQYAQDPDYHLARDFGDDRPALN